MEVGARHANLQNLKANHNLLLLLVVKTLVGARHANLQNLKANHNQTLYALTTRQLVPGMLIYKI